MPANGEQPFGRQAAEWSKASVLAACPHNKKTPPDAASDKRWLFVSPMDGADKGEAIYIQGNKLSLTAPAAGPISLDTQEGFWGCVDEFDDEAAAHFRRR